MRVLLSYPFNRFFPRCIFLYSLNVFKLNFPSFSCQEMTEGQELWRECVRWMIACGVLDAKHRVAEVDAEIGEFASMLRDGVLLCLLCNRLSENCIDIKNLQQRPQMAQVRFFFILSVLFYRISFPISCI